MPRYSFDEFVLSPRRRLLLKAGKEHPLIPRYFDLLVFLVERRHEAVHRRDIFERVWSGVTVSDSALSQAIRSIRLALGDESRDPRFIRTVSRHGYRFVFTDVREGEDEDGAPAPVLEAERSSDAALDLGPTQTAHATWARASAGAGLSGLVGGAFGGLLLAMVPGTSASFAVVPVLALIGACCGAAGGAGVGAGLSAARGIAGSRRIAALLLGAAVCGGIVGTAAQWLARWSLAALVGVRLDIGGGLEGVVIGAAAGLGYGVATRESGGAPGPRRLHVAAVTAFFCGLAALVLTSGGRPLVGGTIHALATGSHGSQVALTPLGRLLGEPDFGPISSAIIGTGEGVLFGLGLALGLTRRPD
ncbi:MAG: transcriptional regulator [Vicinamibacterales bacterium]